MKINDIRTVFYRSMNLSFISLFLLVWLVSACNPIFELDITVQDQPPPILGKVAYIRGGDVWIYDLDDDQTARLTLDGYNSHPQWSADGSQIAFMKKNQLWVMDSISHQVVLFVETPVEWFEWSPAGATLAYFLNNSGLFTWDISQETGKILLPVAPGNTLESFMWSNDESIVYTDGTIKNGNYWLSVNQINTKDGSIKILYETSDLQEIPHLASTSIDGQWITFWLWETAITFPGQEGLFLCALGVTDQLIQCAGSRTLPSQDFLSWSPENRVAFISTTAEENRFKNSLVIADSKGFTEELLVKFTSNQSSIHPEWTSDGDYIAYSAGPVNQQKPSGTYEQIDVSLFCRRIWVVDTGSKKAYQLTDDERYCDDFPKWSVDGDYILFFRLDSNNASLWLMKSNGSDLHQVVSELTPKPEPLGEYGFINSSDWWDWWFPVPS